MKKASLLPLQDLYQEVNTTYDLGFPGKSKLIYNNM